MNVDDFSRRAGCETRRQVELLGQKATLSRSRFKIQGSCDRAVRVSTGCEKLPGLCLQSGYRDFKPKKLSAEVTNVRCPPLLGGSQAEPALQSIFLVAAGSTAP